jgi:hypothetical protein
LGLTTGAGPKDEIADEAARLLESDQASRQVPNDDHVDKEQEDDQGVDRDETDPYNETIFRRRRPDSIAVDWTSKVLYVLEFKRTSDQRQNYRERGEYRARAQHGDLVKSLEKVAGEADGENGGWKIKLIVFVGGTCGSVHAQTFSNNLKELGVVESKRNTVRKGLMYELLNAQDTVLCSYFAQRSGERGEGRSGKSMVEEAYMLRSVLQNCLIRIQGLANSKLKEACWMARIESLANSKSNGTRWRQHSCLRDGNEMRVERRQGS